MARPTFYIIDAHAYIHRAYHALPPLMSPKGIMVNAVFGFVKLLIKIVREKKPSYIVVCFDNPAEQNRKKIYPAYKATRKPVDEDLIAQFPLVEQTVDIMQFTSFSEPGYEADDLIATLARRATEKKYDTVIVSGDKDTLQLINEHVSVWNLSKDLLIDPSAVVLTRGVRPDQIVDVFSLMGDSSDNVPGVPGVGLKTATSLIQQFGSLDNLYDHLDEVKEKLRDKLRQHRDKAFLSRSLVTLDAHVPVAIDFSGISQGLPESTEIIRDHFKELGFNSIVTEFKVAVPDMSTMDKHYTLVADEASCDRFFKEWEQTKRFALDTETTGLDTFNDSLVGISLSCQKDHAFYIPMLHAPPGMFSKVKKFLERDGNRIIGHNLKFDFLVLENAGIHIKDLYFDTMLASYLINPSRSNHRLKDLALDHFSFRMREYAELTGTGKKAQALEEIDIREVSDYACADADATYMLYVVMAGTIKEKDLEKLFFDVEMPLLKNLADMERSGIKVDVPYLNRLSVEFAERLKKSSEEIYTAAGQEFNINSPKQLAAILFEKFKLPVVRRTKTGYSTDDDVLEELSAHHLLPRLIRDYREIQKLKSTYIDVLVKAKDKKNARVHASFNQAVTATGRLSSSNPNLQNIPIRTESGRMIRRAFIPERGHVFISADYSQIDLRVLAHLSGDNALVSAFQSGGDIHRATASDIYGIPVEQVDDEMRSHAKAINFGIMYGQRAFGLAQALGIPRAEAQQFIENYFQKYAGVKEWIEATLKEAVRTGMVSTILGRIRYVPELSSSHSQIRAFGERLAMNTPIQGSAADIIKVAMIRIYDEIQKRSLKSKMLVQVHDDLLVEVPAGEEDIIAGIMKDKMEHAIELSVPLVVDMKSGNNWSDLRKLQLRNERISQNG